MADSTGQVVEVPELHNRARVFRDRTHAGSVLAGLLEHLRGTDAVVLAIPAGGVPVAAEVALQLGLPLDLAVVSKITLPWDTESGYGAVAFDGTVRLNHPLIEALGLTPGAVQSGIARTKAKVERRVRELRGDSALPDVAKRTAVLIDDGLASGFTLLTAVDVIRRLGAKEIIVGVPTAPARTAARVSGEVDALYCPNICDGSRFAVADAYQAWGDIEEATVLEILRYFSRPRLSAVQSDNSIASLRWQA